MPWILGYSSWYPQIMFWCKITKKKKKKKRFILVGSHKYFLVQNNKNKVILLGTQKIWFGAKYQTQGYFSGYPENMLWCKIT